MRARLLISIVLILMALPAAQAQQARQPHKHVLILDSFGRNVSLDSLAIAAFRAELARQWPDPIDFHEIPLEAARIDKPENDPALAEFVATRLAGQSVDLVVPFSEPAMAFAIRNRDRLFDEAPFLIALVERRHVRPEILTPKTAFVGLDVDLPALVEGILRVLPRTRTIAVVLGSSSLEKYWRTEAEREFQIFANRVRFLWLTDHTFDEMKREVAALPPDSAVLYGTLWRDAAGVTFQADQALESLRAVANAPFFTCSETEFGAGVVGGRLFPYRSVGIQAAAAAVRIFHGESPARVSVPPLGSLPPVYDWRELKRWGISESLLPPGSTVHFRPTTIWQHYRNLVAAVAGVVALQTVLIIGLLLQGRRRRRVEQDLALSKQRLQLIANSLPALIAHIDRNEHHLFADRAYEEWFGLNTDQVLALSLREVLGDVLYRSVQPYVARALAGEQVAFTTISIMKGGQSRSLDSIFVPDRDELGEVQGFYALVLDATDRVRAQNEARLLLYELAHANRLSMMGELATALAHELNQPLTAIMSNARAAQRFLNGPDADLDEVREILGDITDDGARAAGVIQRMRTLVKKERAGVQSLDVNQVLHEVVSLLRNDALMHKVLIELELDHDLRAVEGDRIELQQVVMNLLLNAFDAIEESSPENRTVQVATHGHDTEVTVTVRDHGAGIPRATLDRLFEPFNSSKPKGLGMGLSISQSIVGVHGGRLWAENNPDGGATFSFTLPYHPVPAPSGGARYERVVARSLRGG